MNVTYTALANSLVTIEYFDSAKTVKQISSAASKDANSVLQKVVGDDSHYILDVKFTRPNITLKYMFI